MKTEYAYKHSSLKVTPFALLPKVLEIHHVYTAHAHRNKGYASILLRKVCQHAEKENRILVLLPDNERLASWYATLGFVKIQHTPVILMFYTPGHTHDRKT